MIERHAPCRFGSAVALTCLAIFIPLRSSHSQFPGAVPELQLSPQVVVHEIDNSVRSHFERAKQLLADQRWDDAIDVVSRLLENEGDKLVAVKSSDQRKPLFSRYLPLREFCQQWFVGLAHHAPDALQVYRGRVDSLAERWLKQSKQERSDAPLEMIIDQFFASSYGDDALLQLADAAIERGEYTAARRYLQQISASLRSPAAGLAFWLPLRKINWKTDVENVRKVMSDSHATTANILTYPDTDLNVADVLARLVLVSLLEGADERADIELQWLKLIFPDAIGKLAGRSGTWGTLLTEFRDQSAGWDAARTFPAWPTFAGNLNRDATASRSLDLEGRPLWQVKLAPQSGEKDRLAGTRGRIGEESKTLLSYHPVVVGGHVFVADTNYVRAFRLNDGTPAWHSRQEKEEENERPATELGAIYQATGNSEPTRMLRATGVPRFTLNAYENRLFVKMGSPITREPDDARPTNNERGFLVGLDLQAQGRVFLRIALADAGLDGNWTFEGAPITDGTSLYVALRRRDAVRDQAHLASFDLRTGTVVWRRFLSAAESPYRGLAGISHGLLSLKDGTLYYNTNLGSVAAVSARDGRIRWLTAYPRASYQINNPDKTDRYFQRDLNPCLLFQDLVISAPADCDRVFALDAATGQLVWTTDGDRANDVNQLLGVGANRLIASGDYLYWFDVYSGAPLGQFPPAQKEGAGFARPTPLGYGRGILVADQVWWPTHDNVLVFQQQTRSVQGGWQPIAVKEIDLKSRNTTGGNLVIAHNLLLIASGTKLTAIVGQ